MNWIRTYDFVWLNLDYVACISYTPIDISDDINEANIIGYKIWCETPSQEAQLIGCLCEEDDVFDCIDCIVEGRDNYFELSSEEEIREIYNKSKK